MKLTKLDGDRLAGAIANRGNRDLKKAGSAVKENEMNGSGAVTQDKLTISKESSPLSEAQFVEHLKKHLLSEVTKEAPEYKLSDLRNQIALGEYEINVSEVIRRMMPESER